MSDEGDDQELDPGRALYQRLKREREERERQAAAERVAAAQALADARAAEPRTVIAPAGSTYRHASAAIGGQLPIGTLLNQIYEIRRYIASGGMGEVYEGVNTTTDERVAIKIIQKHLADDPQVNAIFRKEARIHTRLIHPALAQYRMATREPTLGVFYIATEFVDGVGLDRLIGEMIPSEAQLRTFMARLASGLAAAHDLGAIHRDISPDNILVPERDLKRAKIIDFGIARDVQASMATIVGNTFAGKLNYVAPEQFGDFDRRIGPWTDLYSLGLVMYAFATGRAVNMGSSLVEAVDRRRAGVNLTGLSLTMRPIFARMLAANPSDRFQSMHELITALGEEDDWADPAQQFSESWEAPDERTATPERSAPPEPSRPPATMGPSSASPTGEKTLRADTFEAAFTIAAEARSREPQAAEPPAPEADPASAPAPASELAPSPPGEAGESAQWPATPAPAQLTTWTRPAPEPAPAAAGQDPIDDTASLHAELAAEPVVSLFDEPLNTAPAPEVPAPEAVAPEALAERAPAGVEPQPSEPPPHRSVEAFELTLEPPDPDIVAATADAWAAAPPADIPSEEPTPDVWGFDPQPEAPGAEPRSAEPEAPSLETPSMFEAEIVAEPLAPRIEPLNEPATIEEPTWDEAPAQVEALAPEVSLETADAAAAWATPPDVEPEPAIDAAVEPVDAWATPPAPEAEPDAALTATPAVEREPEPDAGPEVDENGLTEEERIYQAARLNPPPDALPPEPPRERWTPFAIQGPVDAASLITHPSALAAAVADEAAEAQYVATPEGQSLPPWSPIELHRPMTALEFASGAPIEPLDEPPTPNDSWTPAPSQWEDEPVLPAIQAPTADLPAAPAPVAEAVPEPIPEAASELDPEAAAVDATVQADDAPYDDEPYDPGDGSPRPVLYALKGLMMRRRRRR